MDSKLPYVAPNGYKSIDTLCGGGGITLAMHLAGFDVQAVLNHAEIAIDSHKVFFTKSLHFRADVRTQWADALGKADYFHMSPDCRDHSRAKGGRPLDPSVRGLAEEAPRYLLACNASVATFENVPEFVDWGPLVEVRDGNGKIVYGIDKETGEPQPLLVKDKSRNGEYYKRWVATLRAMGYVNHQYWILNAADYGSPQARRRYIGVFARAGVKITKPKPTHDELGRYGLPKWRGAIEILEPGNYGKSVFESDYVENTLNRLAAGVEEFGGQAMPWVMKYVSNPPSGKPNPGQPLTEPGPTATTQDRLALVQPLVMGQQSGSFPRPATEPAPTVSTAGAQQLIQIAPFLDQQYGASGPASIDAPAGAVTVTPKLNLVQPQPFLDQQYGTGRPAPIDQPAGTITASGNHHALVQPQGYIMRTDYGNVGTALDEPAATVVASRRHPYLVQAAPALAEPECWTEQPGDSDTMRHIRAFCRAHAIADVLMRMLFVAELSRIQGFPEGYTLTGGQTNQKKQLGNAVEVKTATALGKMLLAASLTKQEGDKS